MLIVYNNVISAEGPKRLTVTVKFQYDLIGNCDDAVRNNLHTTLMTAMRNKLKEKKTTWSGLCDSSCSNVAISYACVSNELEMTVIFKSIQ